MVEISLCMITKDEEQILPKTLRAIAPYVDEINIVDTGSSDKTVNIARQFTERVFFFEWCDDFSAAKNFAISKATKPWVLLLDADEFIAHPEQLKKYIDSNKSDIYMFRKLDILFDATAQNIREEIVRGLQNAVQTKNARLFKNTYSLVGKVHERLDAPDHLKLTAQNTIYNLSDRRKLSSKKELYNRIGERELEEGSKNGNILINLLIYYTNKGNIDIAKKKFTKYDDIIFEERIRFLVEPFLENLLNKNEINFHDAIISRCIFKPN